MKRKDLFSCNWGMRNYLPKVASVKPDWHDRNRNCNLRIETLYIRSRAMSIEKTRSEPSASTFLQFSERRDRRHEIGITAKTPRRAASLNPSIHAATGGQRSSSRVSHRCHESFHPVRGRH